VKELLRIGGQGIYGAHEANERSFSKEDSLCCTNNFHHQKRNFPRELGLAMCVLGSSLSRDGKIKFILLPSLLSHRYFLFASLCPYFLRFS
jgi:hypothetical protein